MASVTLRTLGEFVLTFSGETLQCPQTKKARALIAYLVMHRSSDVARERLLEVFWPDFDPQRGRDNLKTTLWSVRRIFRKAALNPDDFLQANHTIVRWHATTDFDVDRLLELAAKIEEPAANEVASLYGGDFLEGDLDDWPVAERERLALVYEALLARATKGIGSISAAEQLIGRNPYDEAAYTTLIEARMQAGQTVAAAILVERCRCALEEVGLRPSERFEKLFGELRRSRDGMHSASLLPFVPRDAELRFLAERFTEAAATGSVTIVHGDAGIGKSTLLAEAARIAEERGFRTLQVRCTGGRREDVSIAAEAIAKAAGHLVVVVDDAQNLARDALSFFSALANSNVKRHCFVVAVRPEALSDLQLHLEPSSPFEVALGPLSRTEMEDAFCRAAGSDLSGVFAKLFERTGGHPLYMVRLLEALVEDGALECRRRIWSVTEKFDRALPLPGSVRAFIESRLVARGNVAGTVAGALAIEPSASPADLRSVLSLEEDAILDALDDLLALGLITQPQTGPQFEFSHDLVREVAGSRLNAGRAARIHRRFAELLQRAPERDGPERVASHFLGAGDVLGAGRAFVRAARSALESGELPVCISACERGINTCRRLERSAERDGLLAMLYDAMSSARFALGQPLLALDNADQAVGFARGTNSGVTLASALVERARCDEWVHQGTSGNGGAEEAASIARRIEDHSLLAASLTAMSRAARHRYEKELTLEFAREAYSQAVLSADWPQAQSAVGEALLARCAWWDTANAPQLMATSHEFARRCGASQQAVHHNLVALFSYVLGRYADARSSLATASLTDELLPPPAFFFNRLLSAIVALAEARWDSALKVTAELEARIELESLPAQRSTLAALRIDALLSRNAPGDTEYAEGTLQAAGELSHLIFPWNICAEITYARTAVGSKRSNAARLLRKALDAAEERAHRLPFDADRAFAQIAVACRAAGNDAMATRATLRYSHYRKLRGAPSDNGEASSAAILGN